MNTATLQKIPHKKTYESVVERRWTHAPFAVCATNTGWKINPSKTTWDTHYRVWKEEITAKKQAGICWIESNSKYTTPTYEYKKVKTFEATPTYHWLVTNAPRNPFARSLMKYYKRHNQLTEKQLAAIEQNLKRPHHWK